jgi:hypothetical protein
MRTVWNRPVTELRLVPNANKRFRRHLSLAFAVLCCLLVVAYFLVAGYAERQRGRMLQSMTVMDMLGLYLERNDGSWPASIDDLKDQGLISQTPEDGCYRFPDEVPMTIGNRSIRSTRLFNESYLHRINFGVVRHMNEVEIVNGGMRRKGSGQSVRLFVGGGLDLGGHRVGTNALYRIWRERQTRSQPCH